MATVMAAPTRPWSVWRDWGVIRGVVIYMALAWAWIISDEVFAVQALTSTENNGLGMTSANLGALGAVIGAVYMATQYKAYAAVDRRFGSVQVLQWSMLLMIPSATRFGFRHNICLEGCNLFCEFEPKDCCAEGKKDEL
eukprot:TRINITY_DN24880_c0_g1_i1.p1 TRINITY_DN24880_c0_g1~~TRINITY_DN24880_c0_g1_i1.p1  ORF type:complete len:139 (+),score=27.20 TRINITY_DN24880_c0_g1_i1:2-418(+)